MDVYLRDSGVIDVDILRARNSMETVVKAGSRSNVCKRLAVSKGIFTLVYRTR